MGVRGQAVPDTCVEGEVRAYEEFFHALFWIVIHSKEISSEGAGR
jgi:hypothetical protein